MNIIPWRKNRELARTEPVTALSELRREFDRVFNRFFEGFDRPFELLGESTEMRFDLAENEKGYSLRFELPGVDPKDVQVDVTGTLLTIRGEKGGQREEKNERCWYSERTFGRFQRSVQLPSPVLADQVEATFKNGVLTVSIPKDPKSQPRRIAVKTN
jgi:HSP20 family protein